MPISFPHLLPIPERTYAAGVDFSPSSKDFGDFAKQKRGSGLLTSVPIVTSVLNAGRYTSVAYNLFKQYWTFIESKHFDKARSTSV